MFKTKIKKISVTFLVFLLNSIQVAAVTTNDLMPRSGSDNTAKNYTNSLNNLKNYPEVANVAKLPQLTTESLIKEVIKTILSGAMLLTMIALVIAGIYYLQSRGKEEDITKAKDIIIYLLIGMAIIASAYAIIVGISQFQFFDSAG